jgi:hypothetical protein
MRQLGATGVPFLRPAGGIARAAMKFFVRIEIAAVLSVRDDWSFSSPRTKHLFAGTSPCRSWPLRPALRFVRPIRSERNSAAIWATMVSTGYISRTERSIRTGCRPTISSPASGRRLILSPYKRQPKNDKMDRPRSWRVKRESLRLSQSTPKRIDPARQQHHHGDNRVPPGGELS